MVGFFLAWAEARVRATTFPYRSSKKRGCLDKKVDATNPTRERPCASQGIVPAFTLCVELETWTPTTVVCPFQLPFKPTFSVPSKHRGEHATGCLFVSQANRLKKLLGGFHPETPVCSFRWVLGPLKHGRPNSF